MIINNIEVDFDIFETENLKKFEIGIEEIDNEIHNTTSKTLKQYEQAEIYCKGVINLCNNLFGEEKANKILEGIKGNFLKCTRIFGEIVDKVAEEQKKSGIEFNKYSSNRAQRRSNKK